MKVILERKKEVKVVSSKKKNIANKVEIIYYIDHEEDIEENPRKCGSSPYRLKNARSQLSIIHVVPILSLIPNWFLFGFMF